MKYIVIVAFIAILGSLAVALVFMLRGSQGAEGSADAQERIKAKRMARALAFRVGFSVLLFALVLLAYFMGWIQPTGLPLQR